jgi:hypothetical protein
MALTLEEALAGSNPQGLLLCMIWDPDDRPTAIKIVHRLFGVID